jgi:hypothetical protein
VCGPFAAAKPEGTRAMLPPILHRRRRPRRRDLTPGRYLTDGRRLLCVVGRFEIPGSMLVSVEDCSSFERLLYTDIELETLRFRRVWTPARPAVAATDARDPVDLTSPAGGQSLRGRVATAPGRAPADR